MGRSRTHLGVFVPRHCPGAAIERQASFWPWPTGGTTILRRFRIFWCLTGGFSFGRSAIVFSTTIGRRRPVQVEDRAWLAFKWPVRGSRAHGYRAWRCIGIQNGFMFVPRMRLCFGYRVSGKFIPSGQNSVNKEIPGNCPQLALAALDRHQPISTGGT